MLSVNIFFDFLLLIIIWHGVLQMTWNLNIYVHVYKTIVCKYVSDPFLFKWFKESFLPWWLFNRLFVHFWLGSKIICFLLVFSSHGQRPCVLLPSLGVRPSVVRCKLSHLNLLLWNPWTKLNQTWQGWSLGGSLSKLCLTDLPSIQDGCCY